MKKEPSVSSTASMRSERKTFFMWPRQVGLIDVTLFISFYCVHHHYKKEVGAGYILISIVEYYFPSANSPTPKQKNKKAKKNTPLISQYPFYINKVVSITWGQAGNIEPSDNIQPYSFKVPHVETVYSALFIIQYKKRNKKLSSSVFFPPI